MNLVWDFTCTRALADSFLIQAVLGHGVELMMTKAATVRAHSV